jgi:hypothetical protein
MVCAEQVFVVCKRSLPVLEFMTVVMWTAFVCGYLVWQQINGDMS